MSLTAVGYAVPSAGTGRPQPVGEVETRRLIAWRTDADGVWTGSFAGHLDAGTISRTASGFAVTNWVGEPEGTYASLAEAQLALEPDHRAALREQTATHTGTEWIPTVTASFGLVAAGLASIAWFVPLMSR